MAKDKGKDKDKSKNTDDIGAETAPPKGVFAVVKQSVTEFLEDNCLNLAAAIAYFALQSVIPLILGFIVLGSLFLQDPGTRQGFIDGVKNAVPPEVGNVIKFDELLDGLIKGAGAAGAISILTLFWTGSGIFDQFVFAINQAYDVEKDERNFFVKMGLRLGMLIGLGALLAAAFTITILFNLLVNAGLGIFGISPKNFSFILPVLSYVIPLLLEAAIFTILYKFSPARKDVKWKPVLIGAAVAAVLFELLKVGFTFYLTAFGAADSATKTYGAIGGIIVFMFFLYLSAAVILFGAEVAAVLNNFKSGSAAVKAGQAIVEQKAETNQHGQMLPDNSQPAEGSKKVKGPPATAGAATQYNSTSLDEADEDEEFDYGLAGKDKLAVANAYSHQLQSKKDNPLTLITGTVVLIIAGIASIIFRRKNPAA